MFKRLRTWFQRERQWHRDHVETWAGWTTAEPDGLCRFQRTCEAAVATALNELGVSLHERRVVETKEGWKYVHFLLSPTELEFWLYCDTVEFTGRKLHRRLEEWDHRTPEDMVTKVVELALEVVNASKLGAA
jgi:hypothetical protein